MIILIYFIFYFLLVLQCEVRVSAAPVVARADLVERIFFYALSLFYLFLTWLASIYRICQSEKVRYSELVLILLCFSAFIIFLQNFPRPVLSKYGLPLYGRFYFPTYVGCKLFWNQIFEVLLSRSICLPIHVVFTLWFLRLQRSLDRIIIINVQSL